MKSTRQKFFAAARALAVGLSLSAFAAAPASAQSNNNNGGAAANREERRDDDRRDNDRREVRVDRDDDRDWGWLGLLGLAGLLGLMPRKRVPVVHEARDVREPDPRDRR